MKQMARRPLVALPNNEYVKESTPFSTRIVHAAEVAGWALMTFAVLYFGLHIIVTVFG